ncbi:U4/U6 small nuclear ribonucleoprotein Prp4 [Geodia barretti]|uniref:U4/U6 small nuclear ribonucleoprotein Prp4 n=1 Tax=Geodia barretti TaxID=519541 RepID=A0AA35TKV7_GEOBA|nr:U4/U6 small nuclear ribonucleoprotein Prp4 [Geodia barretti]
MEPPTEKKARLHFGSLEEQERVRLQTGGSSFSSAVREGILSGNINITPTTGGVGGVATVVDGQQLQLLQEFERRKRAKAIVVPTDDSEVKVRLRDLGEPTCLFGEDPANRRERLRELLSAQLERGELREAVEEATIAATAVDEGVWFHEGPEQLLNARYWIADYSIPRAQKRLQNGREEAKRPGAEKAARTQELHKALRSLSNSASQVGDERPVSFCQFSPDSQQLATCSWSGLCKLWSLPSCNLIRVLRSHNERAGSIVWHPQATISLSPTALNLASCAADGSISLWDLQSDTPMGELEGHAHRISRIAFHPSGRFLAAASFDHSWRLWDLECRMEVLHQEGHSRPVYSVCFHPDGSLAGSCGLDSCGRVWDLRTGRCLMLLDGHLQSVLAMDFSPNGYHVATGGNDNAIRLWDLRKQSCVYTIPAHTNLVSHVKFQSLHGGFLVSSSYDNSAKIWAHPGWTPLRTLAGHEGKVMCVDVSPNQKYFVTASYDRTFKLWENE